MILLSTAIQSASEMEMPGKSCSENAMEKLGTWLVRAEGPFEQHSASHMHDITLGNTKMHNIGPLKSTTLF